MKARMALDRQARRGCAYNRALSMGEASSPCVYSFMAAAIWRAVVSTSPLDCCR